jgi:hypothetical protein
MIQTAFDRYFGTFLLKETKFCIITNIGKVDKKLNWV